MFHDDGQSSVSQITISSTDAVDWLKSGSSVTAP